MDDAICPVVFSDGAPCGRPRKHANGLCGACREWSRRNDAAPQGRPNPNVRKPVPACSVTFVDGTPCGRPKALKKHGGICRQCDKWSAAHGGADPRGRRNAKNDPGRKCTVVYSDGTPCGKPAKSRSYTLCIPCANWSRENDGDDPNGRRRWGGYGERLAFLEDAAHATTDECLIVPWANGSTHPMYQGRTYNGPAARWVWIARFGDPGQVVVRHTCNGGSGAYGCVNIRHLRLGTQGENIRDMVEAGRSARGERNALHRLTEGDVQEVRRLLAEGATQKDIAAMFGVHKSTIGAIPRGRTWAWLPHAASDRQDDMRIIRGTFS